MSRALRQLCLLSLAGITSSLTSLSGCSTTDGSTVEGGAAKSGSSTGGTSATSSSGGGPSFGGALVFGNAGSETDPQPGVGGDGSTDCEGDFAGTQLKPVRLAFAFDVSGSMGKLDYPYHDPELKWRPVVAATRAFFEDDASAGISASLSFFPAEDDKCDAATYEQPDVAMTALPSPAFGEAITAIDPMTSDDWRGGTPTLAVVQGTTEYLLGLIAAEPEAAHALVLVTDGYPNGCDDDDIASVVDEVAMTAGSFPTYVIGVKNPAGGPDTVSDLNDLAVAGGTEAALFIDTGDPDKTALDLSAAIEGIRERSVSCDAPIPAAPGGKAFREDLVNVAMTVDGVTSKLGYDKDCEGEQAWRFEYNTEMVPTKIVLCPSTCEAVQQTPGVELSVEFGCMRRQVVK